MPAGVSRGCLRTRADAVRDRPRSALPTSRTQEVGERAKRRLDWAKVVQYHLIGVIERGGDYHDDIRAALVEHPDEIHAVTEAIERPKAEDSHWYTDKNGKRRLHSHWSGKSTADIAREVDCETRYDIVSREASQYVHSGMHGLTGFFRVEEPNLVVIDAQPSAAIDEIRGVLGSAAIDFAHVALDWAEIVGAEDVTASLREWLGS